MKVSHSYYLAISGLGVGKQKTVDWDSWRILNPVEKWGGALRYLALTCSLTPFFFITIRHRICGRGSHTYLEL